MPPLREGIPTQKLPPYIICDPEDPDKIKASHFFGAGGSATRPKKNRSSYFMRILRLDSSLQGLPDEIQIPPTPHSQTA
jgi:hypothetical protein